MKKYIFIFGIALFATALLTSCGPDCDPSNPQSECYVPCDPTDPTSDCYEQPCDPTDPTSDCYEPDPLVDAGVVINGIKWATRNVDMPGTFAATPESSGMFYQWNRKIGWSSSDPMVSSNGDTEWDATNPEGTEWTKSNDPCPQGWRVPTHDEQLTLLAEDDVEHEWTSQNSINGRLFTDKVSSKKLFLPAAGLRYGIDSALDGVGTYGGYWSSTQRDEFFAYYLHFYSGSADWGGAYRSYGLAVRCVTE